MTDPRPEKVAVVGEVKAKLESARAVAIAEYRGIDVARMANLRNAVREAGGEFKIYKNTLVRFAAKDLDLEIEDLLTGPNALAFTDTDAVALAKALSDFAASDDDLVIKGGLLGTDAMSAADITALAKLPSRDEMLAKFAGLLQAPTAQFARLLAALPQKFAYGLQALIDKGGAPGAPAAASEPADEPEASASDEPPADQSSDDTPADDAPSAQADTESTAADPAAEPTDEESADTQES